MQDRSRQKGSITLTIALLLPVLIGVLALAIDIVYLQLVKNELQNDADAAALAGARSLYDGSSLNPQWDPARLKALEAVSLNRAAGQALVNGDAQTGYWNLQGQPSGLQALPMKPGNMDVAAVQVTVTKANGLNGGPAETFLARLWGVQSLALQATAVAGISSPSQVDAGQAFALVLQECMFKRYWDSNANPPGPTLDPATRQPYVFQLSETPIAGCRPGYWTSFLHPNSGSNVVSLTNPEGLAIGDVIWFIDGVKASILDDVEACSGKVNTSCSHVVVPIVADTSRNSSDPILAFGCMHIVSVKKSGNVKYVNAQLGSGCTMPASGGAGTGYGVLSPPSLLR
jgi:Flp pilus assembly protein TadG